MMSVFHLRRLALGALLGLCASTPTAAAAPVPDANRFGVGVERISGAPSPAALNRAVEAGFGWMHYVIHWSTANPAEDVYEWRDIDENVRRYTEAGLNIYMRVTFPPPWATGASYPNHAAPYFCYVNYTHPDCANPALIPSQASFEKFARALVTRYADRVKAWGFSAEVNTKVFWQGTQEQFVQRMLLPGYRIVKEIDPSLTVVGPDEDVPSHLESMMALESRHGRFCDVISFHLLRHSGASFSRVDDELRPIFNRYGAGRPLWITELGMMVLHSQLNDGIQASWLEQMVRGIIDRPWIDKSFVLGLESFHAEDFGILYPDESPKPAYNSLKTLLATQSTPRFYYLAEGATGNFFDLDLCIANPNAAWAPVKIAYLRDDGTRIVNTPLLPPQSRTTIRVDSVAGLENTAVSTVVESTTGMPIVVERTMFWDQNWYGGHTGGAAESASTRWYFAEGSEGFFNTWVLLANSSISPAAVTVEFLTEGAGVVRRTYNVSATSRFSIWAGSIPELVGKSFSIVVDADRPILAERAMYFGSARFWDGGHNSVGVTAPATSWWHAEGATGAFFDTYILVGNPNDTSADVTFTWLLPSGETVTRTQRMTPHSRLTLNVEAQDPRLRDTAVSTTVTANVPVISERSMYWSGVWEETHNSFGVTQTGTRWGLAEGRTGGEHAINTFILLANGTNQRAQVRVTFLRNGRGEPIVKTYDVPATSRFNVWVNTEVPELVNTDFAAVVESTNGVPIAVERAMYWDSQGRSWAGGSNATGVLLP